MKSAARSLGILLVLWALASSAAVAVPPFISYQGSLHNQGGSPVNGSVSITFRLFSAATGGSALWTETQDLTVSNGIFSVELGVVTPLPSSVFGSDSLYLAIKVGADQEMSPRQRLTTAAFSHRAETVTALIVPIGSIIAWHKSMPGTPALLDGWVECNGQVLADPLSPLSGQTIPDLNGVSGPPRFLRGSTASGGFGGSETHAHTLDARTWVGSGGNNWWHNTSSTIASASTLPSYVSIIWIMRVR